MVAALMATVTSTSRNSRKGNAATLRLLQAIAAADGARPSDLATALDVHPSTISRQMQSLEEEGLIALSADTEDRRSCALSATVKGLKRIQDLQEFGLSRFELFVADWTEEEIRTFAQLLEKFEVSKARIAASEKGKRERRSWQATR